jgi:hypothetical protein
METNGKIILGAELPDSFPLEILSGADGITKLDLLILLSPRKVGGTPCRPSGTLEICTFLGSSL